MGDRVNEIDHRQHAFDRRVDERLRSVDGRVAATRTHADLVRLEALARIDQTRRTLARVVITGLVLIAVATVALCLATTIAVV
jgi:hypothetical protein